ncbi:helix-turn-helix domain-containing protein [Sediminitomix flava]|uniref:Transposase n=1 Tax=Sediminitomix flava TaxID=379075 RepID=A0A315ZCG7_SEDFL|nr:winged helix-turn-helix domain-containing protein [Sediminitomix flava]PWJ42809.1 transposase [Sediminitomix flava]
MKELISYQWKTVCRLSDQGMRQYQIAKVLELSESRVSQILKNYHLSGEIPVYDGGNRGATPRLSKENKLDLGEKLKKGAEYYGFKGDIWTLIRVQAVIEKEFGVKYGTSQISNILKEIGWSWQKPKKRLPSGFRKSREVA